MWHGGDPYRQYATFNIPSDYNPAVVREAMLLALLSTELVVDNASPRRCSGQHGNLSWLLLSVLSLLLLHTDLQGSRRSPQSGLGSRLAGPARSRHPDGSQSRWHPSPIGPDNVMIIPIALNSQVSKGLILWKGRRGGAPHFHGSAMPIGIIPTAPFPADVKRKRHPG